MLWIFLTNHYKITSVKMPKTKNPNNKKKIKYTGQEIMVDALDKKILNTIQSRFPVESRPYLVLADQLDMSEEEVWKRINVLRSKGVIRRVGAVFDSASLGFHSTLVAVKANPALVEEVIRKINVLPGLTHHYERADIFNLWFTLTARDKKTINNLIKKISKWEGVIDIMELPATQTFKIKVDFQI